MSRLGDFPAFIHVFWHIKVFAIGIGAGVDKNELAAIATDAQHVFQVTNFDALGTLQAELKKTACKSKTIVSVLLR